MAKKTREAVILLSGGIDSSTTAALAREAGFDINALTILYGQRHVIEQQAAIRIAKALPVKRHVFQTVDLRVFGGSALTDSIEVPKSDDSSHIGHEIPVTYVPARNTIFLALALGYAEAIGSADIFIGVNSVDYSGYPDCRPEFLASFERLANLATKAGVEGGRFRIHAPLIAMSKAEIIRQGHRLGTDFSLTHSCYDPVPDGLACGRCDSCLLRRQGFEQAGLPDPTRYAQNPARHGPGPTCPPDEIHD
jgi:7-cyano-7-deazaguanine synthase